MRTFLFLALLAVVGMPQGTASAADVYINGVRVGLLANTELRGATVVFDAQGNIHITAPGYQVVVPGAQARRAPASGAPGAHSSSPSAAPTPSAVRPGAAPVGPPRVPVPPQAAPRLAPGPADVGAGLAPAVAGAMPGRAPVGPVRAGGAVQQSAATTASSGQYWLVTQARHPGAAQYQFEVYINGTLVRTIDSSQVGLTIPLDSWLHRGRNVVRIRATKVLAGARQSTDPRDYFTLLIGRGVPARRGAPPAEVSVRYRLTAAEVASSDDQFPVVVP